MTATGVAAVNPPDRRASPRLAFGRQGTLRLPGQAALEIAVSELTRDGCRIHTELALLPHVAVEVGLAHVGLTAGQIVWRSSNGYGCRFNAPLAPGAVTAAQRRSNVTPFSMVAETAVAPSAKSAPFATLATLVGLTVGGWALIGLAVVLTIRL